MNERGFTLTELLVACAVVGIVMAGVFTLQQQGQSAYLWGSARVEVQQNARLALDLMTRELRSAQSIALCTPNTKISFTDSSSVATVYEQVDSRLLRTRNAVSNTTVDIANNELIRGVQTFTVTCYTSDGYTSTTTASDVRSIVILLRTQVSDTGVTAGSMAAQRAVVESRIRLRNL